MAGASVNMSSSFGIAGQGVTFGTASPSALAAVSGKSLGAFEYAQMGKNGAQVTAAAQEQWVNNMLSGIGSGIPNLRQLAAKQANSNGGNTDFSAALLNSGNFSVEQAKAILSNANVSFDPNASSNTIMTILAGEMSGKANISTATRVSTAQQAIAAAAKGQNDHPGLKNQIAGTAVSDWDPLAEANNLGTGLFGGKGTEAGIAADLGLEDRTYTDTAKSNIDKYITAHGGQGGTNLLSSLFENGQSGKVSLGGKDYSVNQALSNSSLMNQIASGKGMFIDSKGNKKDITSLERGGSSGSKGGKGSGTVTISPTAQLLQMFNFATSGSASMDSSATQVPPSQSPAFLPSGN